MMIAYVVDSFRLYALRKEYTAQQSIGAAVALAVIGYLAQGSSMTPSCLWRQSSGRCSVWA